MSNYESYQPSILPAFLAGVNGLAYAATLGELKDTISDEARAAAVVGMPNALQPEALPAIAFERQLQRGLAETDAQFAERLRTAPDAWQLAGTPLSILLQLEVIYPTTPMYLVQQAVRAYGLQPPVPGGTIYDRLVIYTLPGGGWVFDNNSGFPLTEGFWSRFSLLIYDPPSTWTDIVEPPTSLTAPTLNEVNDITKIVLKWKPAKATFMGTIVRISGPIWDWPPDLWDAPGLDWNGTGVTFAPTLY